MTKPSIHQLRHLLALKEGRTPKASRAGYACREKGWCVFAWLYSDGYVGPSRKYNPKGPRIVREAGERITPRGFEVLKAYEHLLDTQGEDR